MQVSMIVAIIVLFNAFLCTLYMIYCIATSIHKELKKEVFRYIKIFNQYLEGEQENQTMVVATSLDGSEPESKSISDVSLPVPDIPKAQPMQNKQIFDDYMSIRRAFRFDMKQVIDDLVKENDLDSEKEERVIEGILDKLNFENIYQIITLQPEQQHELLMEIFDADELECLQDYDENREEPFDCNHFVTFLNNRKRQMNRIIFIHSNEEVMMTERLDERVFFCKDEKICEGFQIYYGAYVYDYGILKSDLMNE